MHASTLYWLLNMVSRLTLELYLGAIDKNNITTLKSLMSASITNLKRLLSD